MTTEFERERLGARVRRLRMERSIPQEKLAINASVDQSGLSKFERGVGRSLGAAALQRIAAVLGVPYEDLLCGTDYTNESDSAPASEQASSSG